MTTARFPHPGFSPTPPVLTQEDKEHLHLLAVGHTVMGCVIGLSALLPLFMFGLPVLMNLAVMGASTHPERLLHVISSVILSLFGVAGFAALSTWAVVCWLVARALDTRRHRSLVMVGGILQLMHAPFGTMLGIFTLVVLERPAVIAAFRAAEIPPPSTTDGPSPPDSPVVPS